MYAHCIYIYVNRGSKPALDDRMMAVCVRLLSLTVAKGEAALVFVAGGLNKWVE